LVLKKKLKQICVYYFKATNFLINYSFSQFGASVRKRYLLDLSEKLPNEISRSSFLAEEPLRVNRP
jgi:hypothetical protein